MNLVIPIGSQSKFFPIEEFGYPKSLIEINQVPMIQIVIENITKNINFKKIIFVVRREECDKYHLDETLKLITPIKPVIVKINNDTAGALCSVLLAIDHMDNKSPLLISNADQIFTCELSKILEKFQFNDWDAACATIKSVHPRWSYVSTNGDEVVEAAEKRPISKNAIAGLYYYKKTEEFFNNSIKAIKFGPEKDKKYYISSVFNQYILEGMKVGYYPLPTTEYHSFYTPQKIKDFEKKYTK